MSAFVHGDDHLNAILSTAAALALPPVELDGVRYDLTDADDRLLVGQLLRAENVRSVNERYDENEPLDAPFALEDAEPVSPLACFKAIASLDYQCCETPDWEQTRECRLLVVLQDTLRPHIARLVGRPLASGDHVRELPAYQTSAGWLL